MTDPRIAVDGFDEAAFDAAQDMRWREFRLCLADHLAELSPGAQFEISDLWNGAMSPCALLEVGVDDGRLRLTVQIRCLSPDEPERRGRSAMLSASGWVRDGETLNRDFVRRHVDAAALAAEFALRRVWDVPDPAYLLADADRLSRLFAPTPGPE